MSRKPARRARTFTEDAAWVNGEFLARMSHELRTPLNAVLGFAQLLEFDDLTGDQADAVQHILKAGRHLLHLLNDLLDLSRIRAGKLTFVAEPVELSAVAADTCRLLTSWAEEVGVHLRLDIPAQLYVVSDAQRLQQVLLNLLSNAIKYNRPGGHVQLRAELLPSGVRLEVEDTGIGIPPESLAHLFKSFDRLGAERTQIEGSGIGLALTKHLVEAMRGSIQVQSQAGRGTLVSLVLPSVQDATLRVEERERSFRPPSEPELKVIYLERDPTQLAFVSNVLKHYANLDFLTATNVRQGLELLRHPSDIFVLNAKVSPAQAKQLLQRLKRSQVLVIVVGDEHLPELWQPAVASGAMMLLAYPLNLQTLIGVLQEQLLHKRTLDLPLL